MLWLLAVPRVLLLLMTGLGVVGMHTMGHPNGTHDMSIPEKSHMAASEMASTSTRSVPGTLEAMAPHAAWPQPGGGMDPSKVCLAVLTLVGVTILVAAAVSVARRFAGMCTPLTAVLLPLSRGPPSLPPFGLRIADLSVLRQ